jgi:menaquinol-cytochrome c reductase iron-sulfur subunit
MALIGAVPVLGYICSPLRKRRGGAVNGESFADAGALADIPVGEWRHVSLDILHQDGWEKSSQRHSVWVRRMGASEREISVLSPICPHLGCPINWQAQQTQFACPCHGGTFGSDGKYRSGPPPRSMDSLAFEIRNGRLFVQWQDFRIGAAERVPVQS